MHIITDDIQLYLNGEGKFDGRPVLVVNNDFRTTTGQIYSQLCRDRQFAFALGKGLVKRGSDNQWRQLNFKEWEQAITELFEFARLQEPVGEAPRRLVMLDKPPVLFLVTAKQSRWGQYVELFPQVDAPKGALVSRP